jgi:hypothetical protein
MELCVGTGRRKTSELRIVVDTNAAWLESEYHLLTKEIAELAVDSQEHQDIKIRWFLLQIVVRERIFQMTAKALELIPVIRRVERLLGNPLNITEDLLTLRVREAVDRQIADLDVDVQTLDLTSADWQQIVEASIQRSAPFQSGKTENWRALIFNPTHCRFLSSLACASERAYARLASLS